MRNPNRFPRVLLILCLLSALAAGMFSPRMEGVEAMPLGAAPGSVIISEVAWGGTAANSSHEWIELYNTTGLAIDLSNWTLTSNDGSPNITIPADKTIPAYGYFLLESNIDAPISDLFADLTYSGTLSNSGESLTLRDNSATVIDTANISGGDWDGGSGSPNYYSMERVGTAADSSSAWISNDGINRNGLDSSLNLINGTPHNSQIDLSLSMKLTSASGGAPPYNVTYVITLKNEGLGTAVNIQVQNPLPVSMTFVSSSASTGAYNDLTGIWNITSMAANSVATLSITSVMTGSGPDVVTASVIRSEKSSAIPAVDPDPSDNTDAVTIGSSVLNITNTVNNPTPNIGANVVFTISVGNSMGPDANDVSVDALLPSGLSYISHSNTIGTYNSGTGGWNIGLLTSGTSATLTITAKVISSNVLVFTADTSSLNFSNNAASSTVTPIPSTQADLSLSQSWSRSTTSSDTAILSITVTNQDPVNAATNVQVRDLLPSGLTYVSHTSGMNYNSGTGIWSVGTILGGTNTTLSITVKVASSGTSTDNFAEVWLSDQFDIDSTPGNGDVGEDDSTNEEVLVADLSLTQTSDISGSNAVFTVRVTNAGPDDASGVVVSNSRLSNIANYTYISSSATGGTTYNPLNGDWTIGSLPVGTTVTLVVTTIIVVIDENLAEISAVTEVDPDSLPDNNSRTEDDDAATPSANLSLTKTVSNINPEVNTNIIFTVRVSNAGYATATNVEVKDILPSGLTYVSHTSGQTYNSSTGIWSVGTISNGGLREIQITALVATYGIRTNNAEVWKSDQSDPNSDPGDSSTTEDDDDSVTIVTRRAILLNEIAWAGTGTGSLAEDEWIELYNPSDASITISGWTIRKNSCAGSVYITIDSGKSVARDGYFLLERGDDDTVGGVAANQIYTTSVTKLDDAGETLYLCDNSGNQIDTANQQGFSAPPNPWPAGTASSPYGSMERQGNSAEQDSVWVTNRGGTKNGTTAAGGSIYGTPGKKKSTGNSLPTPATVEPTDTPTPLPGTVSIPPRPIINEIHARPGFDWNQDGRADVFDEFIEIKNLTAVDIYLSGRKLDTVNGKKSFTLPDVTLKPGERIVYYSKETNLLLSDGGETVRLSNASGKIYDAFTYTVARAEDQSFCRLPDGNPGDSWFEDCVPTPNLTNTREGQTPASPNGNASPVCNLPDTIPLDFFIPECNGYGADIWNPYYWDFANWIDKLWIQQTNEKWRTFIE
ncbi:MAG: DUF11 domain-containing protein [Chloroflexi bacterium]|nr:DUF11 domain-containing protein [Chloroflexota bacterium]